MSKVLLPTVPIELDRTRNLLFDFNAIAEAEVVIGRTMLDPKIWETLDARTLRALLWASLLHEDEKLTLQEVGKMITIARLPEIAKAIASAWKLSNPDIGESTDDPQKSGPPALQ